MLRCLIYGRKYMRHRKKKHKRKKKKIWYKLIILNDQTKVHTNVYIFFILQSDFFWDLQEEIIIA